MQVKQVAGLGVVLAVVSTAVYCGGMYYQQNAATGEPSAIEAPSVGSVNSEEKSVVPNDAVGNGVGVSVRG